MKDLAASPAPALASGGPRAELADFVEAVVEEGRTVLGNLEGDLQGLPCTEASEARSKVDDARRAIEELGAAGSRLREGGSG